MGEDGVRVIMLGDFINDKKKEVKKLINVVAQFYTETVKNHILH